MITAGSSTAFSGSTAAGRPGATCPSAMARWARCRAGSIAGAGRDMAARAGGVAGSADPQGRVGWSLHFLDSTVVRAHQHAAGARKAGREPGERRGARPLAWRLHDQDPPARRGLRQACYLHADRWSGSRHPAGHRPDQDRRDPAHRPGRPRLSPPSWSVTRPTAVGKHSARPAPARHHPGNPDQGQRAAPARLRSRGIPRNATSSSA